MPSRIDLDVMNKDPRSTDAQQGAACGSSATLHRSHVQLRWVACQQGGGAGAARTDSHRIQGSDTLAQRKGEAVA